MSHLMTNTTKWHVCPVKTQISQGIYPVWSVSLLSACRKLEALVIHWAHSEDWSNWADAQADLSLRWMHCNSVCFVMRRLINSNFIFNILTTKSSGPRQANLVLITYACSEGSGEPAHPRSLARTITARSYKQWIKRNLQTENQIPGPSEWLDMRS